MKIPLHFVNGEVSPAVKINSAIVSHVTTELEITCLPRDLPEFVEVDLTELDVGHSIHVSALKLPQGVTVVVHGRADPVVATAVVPRAQVETEEETAAAAEAKAASAAATAEAEAKATTDKISSDKKDDKKK
jgi:large subunit ribosomal protein L25